MLVPAPADAPAAFAITITMSLMAISQAAYSATRDSSEPATSLPDPQARGSRIVHTRARLQQPDQLLSGAGRAGCSQPENIADSIYRLQKAAETFLSSFRLPLARTSSKRVSHKPRCRLLAESMEFDYHVSFTSGGVDGDEAESQRHAVDRGSCPGDWPPSM